MGQRDGGIDRVAVPVESAALIPGLWLPESLRCGHSRQSARIDLSRPGRSATAYGARPTPAAPCLGLMALGVLAVAAPLVRAEVITTTTALLYGGVFLFLMLYLVSFEVPRQTLQQNAHKLGRRLTGSIAPAST